MTLADVADIPAPDDDPTGAATADVAASLALRSTRRRTVLAAVLVLGCYHTSVWTLVRGLGVDTPLAYLGLVPMIAAAMGYVLARPLRDEPDIHDRHIDRIVAAPLLVVALVSLVVLPARMSTMYWLYRIDLLTMPFFVAGVVALLFGIRMLWRTKLAVLFLFLAWPIPIRAMVTMGLEPLTDLTAAAVRVVVGVVPVAAAAGADGISFRVPFGDDGFLVQVASACSGANGLLGFLLVAGAFALVARGSVKGKVAWLVTGTVVVWLVNVLRIMVILGVGRLAGERAAIDVLHPFAGLVTFSLAVLAMVAVCGRFGLDLPRRDGVSRTAAVMSAVPDARRAVVLLVALAIVGGIFDHGLTAYDPIASSVGAPRIAQFSQVATRPDGFQAEPVASFDNGRRFFGDDSTWIRYEYRGLGTDELGSEVPVLADVINTSNLQSFSDFGLEACYRFHGYSTGGVRRVDLGNGVVGSVLDWADPDGLAWTTVYWVWAVRHAGSVRYERVVLLLNDSNGARVAAPALDESLARQVGLRADELVRSASAPELSERQQDLRGFLVQFARVVIDSAAERSTALAPPQEFGG